MFSELQNTYQGKKVFLTGHTGFKGAWLLKILNLLGADVIGYALAPKTDLDLFYLIDGNDICNSIIADLRDKKKLEEAVLAFQPDFIFHLAAQPLVRLSYEEPAETFEINVVGTANLLNAARKVKGKCQLVLITTDKVYYNNEWIYPYRENDRLGGYDPYSASKACSELVIDSYRNSFFNINQYLTHQKAIAVGRAGNVIGGGDWSKDRLLPDIAQALGTKQKIIIRNPSSVRPWQHVLEPLMGYLLLGAKLEKDAFAFSQAYNFGPYADDALPVKEMVEAAIKVWGAGEYEAVVSAGQPHEAGLLKLDISKATSELGWKPKLNADKAVTATVNWYRAFFENPGNIKAFTEKQVLDFL